MAKKPGEIVRAVHANVGVEAWYRAQLQGELAQMDAAGQRAVREGWTDPNIGFATDAPGDDLRRLRAALAKWGATWQRKFDAMADRLAQQFSDRAIGATQNATMAAFRASGWVVKFRPTGGSIAAYEAVIGENVALIKSIPQQFAKDVQAQVWASVMKGGDLATVSRSIQEKYGVAFRRAALIARDQNNKAKALIENVRRKELGIVEAIWQHSGAGKEPRPTHVEMSSKRYKLEKGMYDEDEKAYVWPGELINCRCTSRAVIPGFED